MSQCAECGLPYGEDSWVEAVIPDSVWEKISPTCDAGGLLCIACMAKRLRAIGLDQKTVPVWLCGTEPLVALPEDGKAAMVHEWEIGDPLECVWWESDAECNCWSSSCGREWQFTDDGPTENDVKFCVECGKRVIVEDHTCR